MCNPTAKGQIIYTLTHKLTQWKMEENCHTTYIWTGTAWESMQRPWCKHPHSPGQEQWGLCPNSVVSSQDRQSGSRGSALWVVHPLSPLLRRAICNSFFEGCTGLATHFILVQVWRPEICLRGWSFRCSWPGSGFLSHKVISWSLQMLPVFWMGYFYR